MSNETNELKTELKAFIENLPDEEKEELKAFLKTLQRKLKEQDFYHRYNICPSCGHAMDEIDGIYQCECGYVHVEEV